MRGKSTPRRISKLHFRFEVQARRVFEYSLDRQAHARGTMQSPAMDSLEKSLDWLFSKAPQEGIKCLAAYSKGFRIMITLATGLATALLTPCSRQFLWYRSSKLCQETRETLKSYIQYQPTD